MANSIDIALSEASGVPFYRQIEEQIRDKITSGELHVGHCLPSVRVLSTELLVSTITTRRAYANLVQSGWIEVRRGRGTFVATPPSGAEDEARVAAYANAELAVESALRLGCDPKQLRAAIERSFQKSAKTPTQQENENETTDKN